MIPTMRHRSLGQFNLNRKRTLPSYIALSHRFLDSRHHAYGQQIRRFVLLTIELSSPCR